MFHRIASDFDRDVVCQSGAAGRRHALVVSVVSVLGFVLDVAKWSPCVVVYVHADTVTHTVVTASESLFGYREVDRDPTVTDYMT